MPFEYSTLNNDEKKAIIENRLRQFEGEHFNHELNKLNVETLPAATPDEKKAKAAQLDQIARDQQTIEQAIVVHQEELEKLDEPS